ncbi:MAG TPA: hypothetical protein VFR19_13085 [Hyphomicrobiaceae bacterium]|nr:hypothetical protein [Hyphomicrobiaceae bacterium]
MTQSAGERLWSSHLPFALLGARARTADLETHDRLRRDNLPGERSGIDSGGDREPDHNFGYRAEADSKTVIIRRR